MKIAYLDCFSGISGDMFLGAMIDAGLDLNELKRELKKLNLKNYEIKTKKAKKNGILATKFDVIAKGRQHGASLRKIMALINKSRLGEDVKEKSREIFMRIAKAEAKVHGTALSKIHFHEIAAIDSIIDIAGAAIAVKLLGLERIYASPPSIGSGFVKCAHGILPVPGPATAELLKGIPLASGSARAELVTPTGAALLAALASKFGEMPLMKIKSIGYGAGRAELEHPNVLRVFIGEADSEGEYENIKLIETNIDDMNPEIYDYAMERLFSKGALDVFLTPIYMKKSRPAVKLSVLADANKLDDIVETIFNETSTFGVRISDVKRRKLNREIISVKTRYGAIRIKVGSMNGKIKGISPEYEDCKRAAIKHNVPLKAVYDEAKGKLL
ncbi:MAG: nickel pincer cofactor biosynthesis protein LarC [Candidatus Diapherotrites archaeon]|nr:nickel pincer cofactor biosynthesis protein LarC [Candidatus Diapherotrites archaeon]